jgi:PLD-like domain
MSMGEMPTFSLPRALAVAAALLIVPAADAAAASPIVYKTLFQDPGAVPGEDLSLENHAVRLINATPEGEKITFTLRDYNRQPISDALIAAQARGVQVDGVIDGGERSRPIVQALQDALGADHFVICGSPTFTFDSCIANSLVPSLQHNKFLTFSGLSDERKDVVLQTSKNFFGPSQLSYYNDMVEIAGDAALHKAYSDYVFDLKAQQRSDNHYFPTDGDGGRNTMFPSPRPQADRDTDDTIVDRMSEIDCSEGGSPSGKGLIRIANMAFRTERAVIMRKLVELKRQGCDIEVIVSNADGDILSGLVSARIPVHPFFLRAITGVRPQVIVHSKFWLVDAKSTVTGARTKLAYVGSSNWRADQQYSDDMLLRIADDGVHARYSEYWELIKSRAASDQTRPATDVITPFSALAATPAPNGAGWNSSNVAVRVAGSDGHSPLAGGLKRLHVEMSGAQSGAWDFAGETNGYNVQDLAVTAEGETTVTFYSEDAKGNIEPARSHVVRIDKTAPTLAGLPRGCELWPPDNRMHHVADVLAVDGVSGLKGLSVSASSNAVSDAGDIAIQGGSVDLRAEQAARGNARTYGVIRATATDVAGNSSTGSGTCVVPRSVAG